MSNLTIENLSRVVSTGDTDALLGAGQSGGVAAEARVAREMRNNGMTPMEAAGGSQPVGDSMRTFSDVLQKSVEQVNTDQVNANTAIKELVAGRSKNIHETMLAIEKADTSLKLMMQVRNKVLDAYKEIMRMQV